MRAVAAATVGVLIVMQTATAPAQSRCSVQGPPYGPTGYVGNAGYMFDYWSHSGTVKGENFYQPGTKNLGATPLTIDWRDAGYFRRGIASGKEAPGECGSDRNPLNIASGLIKYGPNANFDGPVGTFYTRSGAQASRSGGPIDFLVEWESVLDSGEKYFASVLVGAAPVGPNSIRYTFTNKGRPVELQWGGVLTGPALAVVQRQNERLVRGARLVLRTSEPAQFTVAGGEGQSVGTMMAPLSIFIPEGLLLYRDNHRGLAFVSRIVAK